MQIKQLHKTLEDMRSTRHLMNRRGINNFFIFCPKSPIVFQNNFYQVESLFPVFYLITLLRVPPWVVGMTFTFLEQGCFLQMRNLS